MPSYSYQDWKRMNESDDDIERRRAIQVHVTLYDILGRPSSVRGEMVQAKVESGRFFASDPNASTITDEEILPFPVKVDDLGEPAVATIGPQPKVKYVSRRTRKRE